jgi:hypothetical protein
MAKVIEAPNEYANTNIKSLFLAGGITNCHDWQQDLIKYFEQVDELIIYNPRRKNFPIDDPGASLIQITWEYDYLKTCDILSFWFARGSLNPIVLYELGRWGNSSDRPIVVGLDPEYERKQDVIIQTKLSRPEIVIVYSLEQLALQIANLI